MSKTLLLLCVLVVLILPDAFATVGVDISQLGSVSTFSCLRSPGGQGAVEFVIPRVYQSFGAVDHNGIASIKNARSAGIPYVDGYIFPCVPCGKGGAQVSDAINAVRAAGANMGMLWLDIEPLAWKDQGTNRAFITDMINSCNALGVHCGVYSNWNSWSEIVGSWNGAASLPLWYPHYDNSKSFSDFQKFGGWSSPNIKQYIGDASSCGLGVDYNWYPGTLELEQVHNRTLWKY